MGIKMSPKQFPSGAVCHSCCTTATAGQLQRPFWISSMPAPTHHQRLFNVVISNGALYNMCNVVTLSVRVSDNDSQVKKETA